MGVLRPEPQFLPLPELLSQERQIESLTKSNEKLAAKLGDLARGPDMSAGMRVRTQWRSGCMRAASGCAGTAAKRRMPCRSDSGRDGSLILPCLFLRQHWRPCSRTTSGA